MPHATGESLILPVCSAIIRTIYGTETQSKGKEPLVYVTVPCGYINCTSSFYFNSPYGRSTFDTAH